MTTTTTAGLRTIWHHPSAILLIAQLTVVLLYPFLDHSTAGRAVIGVVQMGIVLIATWAVRSTPVLSWVAVVLGAPAMVLTIAEAISPESDAIVLASAAFHVPFYFFVSYAMVRYLFEDDEVTRDELFAVGATFTLLAWAFAHLYVLTQVIWPGSFTAALNSGQPRTWMELLFLSFTTLSSTGLSDVVPVLPHARSFVMIEQVAGLAYVAMVVSWMVGLTVARARARQGSADELN